MVNIEKLSEELSKLTILEAAELVKCLEEKWGIQAGNMLSQNNSAQDSDSKGTEEKKEFNVMLTSVGNKKIQVIKAVRELTSLGLKEAKLLVDSAPKLIKENIPKDEAESIKETLEKQGATIEIQ
jgi:large subunit ribosomal protein L7/L12